MNVLILGGNGERQSVGAVSRAFKRAGHQVTHVCTLPELVAGTNFGRDIDLLFTFKIGEANIHPGFIRSLPIKCKVFWNFDDPFWISKTADPVFAKEHHITLTSCLDSVVDYLAKGVLNAYFLPPAMDEEYYPDWHIANLQSYAISFICTNLYRKKDFPHNMLDRSWMVRVLYSIYGKDFNLWGYGGDIESKASWRGRLEWETTLPKVIESSLVNINNHCIGNQSLYMNERFCQIVSTRRAQFVDRLPDYEDTFGKHSFVYYSSIIELEDQIRYFRKFPEKLDKIGQAGYEAMKGWTYDAFVSEVINACEGRRARPTFMR